LTHSQCPSPRRITERSSPYGKKMTQTLETSQQKETKLGKNKSKYDIVPFWVSQIIAPCYVELNVYRRNNLTLLNGT
jgi:hypothetical protein